MYTFKSYISIYLFLLIILHDTVSMTLTHVHREQVLEPRPLPPRSLAIRVNETCIYTFISEKFLFMVLIPALRALLLTFEHWKLKALKEKTLVSCNRFS